MTVNDANRILLLSKDLMITSRVAGVAKQQGVACQIAESVEELLETSPPESCWAILDLECPSLELPAAVQSLQDLQPRPGRIIAFGPHVKTQLLEAARRAGCDLVLTRGQFDRQITNLLRGQFDERADLPDGSPD